MVIITARLSEDEGTNILVDPDEVDGTRNGPDSLVVQDKLSDAGGLRFESC